MAYQIVVVGIGPGSPDYLLPVARREIENAGILVGSRRALEAFASPQAVTKVIGGDINGVLDFIEEKLRVDNVVVLVSGDPGFYSMLAAIRRRFDGGLIRVIPGLSSAQVAFARIGELWQDARLISMHGRAASDEALCYAPGVRLGILTDGKHTPSFISQMLLAAGWPPSVRVWVCEKLTYPDEQIAELTLQQAVDLPGYEHSVMVVIA